MERGVAVRPYRRHRRRLAPWRHHCFESVFIDHQSGDDVIVLILVDYCGIIIIVDIATSSTSYCLVTSSLFQVAFISIIDDWRILERLLTWWWRHCCDLWGLLGDCYRRRRRRIASWRHPCFNRSFKDSCGIFQWEDDVIVPSRKDRFGFADDVIVWIFAGSSTTCWRPVSDPQGGLRIKED